MVFSSNLFLLWFFPIFIITYKLVPQKLKNLCLLVFSIFFYVWGAPKFIFLLLISTTINFYLVDALYYSNNKRSRTILLVLSIILNLSMLLYFKYANFFFESANQFLSLIGFTSFRWSKVLLPIGISFFTFQSLTYTVDIYRGVSKPLKNVSDYILYILLFPQMIAGPIVRFNTISDQITDRASLETLDNFFAGVFRFTIGLAKKVLIANVLGKTADSVFSLPLVELDSTQTWIGIIAYTFQIYYDFSGYSDMAIGIGRMIGFTFPENFNVPYISTNITEFWRRWHMTLSQWMRDYLYIPLGGNRHGIKRTYFNLVFVFLLSGLWHGADWQFVFWGAYHGFFLVLDRLFLINWLKRIGKIPSMLFTFLIIVVGWVFFRADSFSYAFEFLSNLFAFRFVPHQYKLDTELVVTLVIATLFAFSAIFKKIDWLKEKVFTVQFKSNQLPVLTIISVIFLIICIGAISASEFNPFIYFRF